MPTQVPRLAITPQGVTAPPESAILTGTKADLDAAFGGGMNLAQNETPLGQLATSMSASIADKNDQVRFYVSQVDPAFAEGRMQDGIARIYFISRDPARATAVQANCTGLAGTLIPSGVQAKAADGTLYVCTGGGTIPSSGVVGLPFACVKTGPIPCPAGTLNRLHQIIPGWESITNPAAGALGNVVEGRTAFEARRSASVAINGRDGLAAILANVLAVPGVLDAYAAENSANDPTVVSGVLLPPHSLYVAAIGGDPSAIADAIKIRKSLGCSTVGNTTRLVQDTSYTPPYPAYAISYQQPDPAPILFTIAMVNGADVPSDAADQVRAAIMTAFAGADDGPRARIGSTVFASRFYGPVAALGPWVRLLAIKIGSVTPDGFAVTLRMDQAPVTAPEHIDVAFF